MNSTNTRDTTPATEASGLWHGLIALGQHMHTHGLPDWTDLQLENNVLEVNLPGHAADQWVDSIHLDELHRIRQYGPMVRNVGKGRLPDTGVRVRLTWFTHETKSNGSARRGGPVSVADAVAEVLPEITPRCEDCGSPLDMGALVHGTERGQTLCGACCHLGNPCSWRPCCDEGEQR